jgi:hypothetical protein
LSGTYPNPTVTKVNGGSIPASAPVLASNGSNQIIAASTTGSGSAVLNNTPTITTPVVATGISFTYASTSIELIADLGTGNTVHLPSQSGVLAQSISGTTGVIGDVSLTAGQAATGTATVTGATPSMGCIANPAGGVSPGAAFIPKCEILSSGIATVSVVAVISGVPPATTYNVRVIQ